MSGLPEGSAKPMCEKQRKYALKKEKQALKALDPSTLCEKKLGKQKASTVDPREWHDETPPGQKKILKPLEDDFLKAYWPNVVESSWYSFWDQQKLFQPQTEKDGGHKSAGTYVIAIPPPNVTGRLHIGHALALALQDVLIRWHRVRQFTTLYIPGCDHAGIATQAVVEKKLAREPKDGKSKRQDFSRADFVQLCQDWKEELHQAINHTIRRLGVSVDWSREAFTMNEQLSKAVTETFIRLHSEGMIYRANRLVHWSFRLSTALSTLEVNQIELEGTTKLDVPGYDHKIEFGTLTYFKYAVENSDEFIEIATTRPETMLGDSGIAVHPQDDRYRHLVGKFAAHPITKDRRMRVVADEYVDREFGTGVVKLTPAHDQNDFTMGVRHGLPFINILNEDGTLNNNAGPYAGERRFDARYKIIQELKSLSLFVKQEPNKMSVPICSRSGDVIEPLMKPQWWMKMEPLAKPAIDVVVSGELVIRPEVQQRRYLQWMRNIQDWCLSRQLWWGHQIPAYRVFQDDEERSDAVDDEYWICAKSQEEAEQLAKEMFPGRSLTVRRDEDVLDTWFSSALWPFSTLGWPDETPDLAAFFPTTTSETGWDILPFWVSRMIMFSLRLTGKVPFTDVYCHGLIRDSDGRKMSKSLGNVIDPIDILDGISLDGLHQKLLLGNLAHSEVKKAEQYQKRAFPQGIPEVGADALRFSLINYTQPSGGDINFDVKTMHAHRRFCNKIYQATKYVVGKLGEDFVPRKTGLPTGNESLAERWILTKMDHASVQVNRALEQRDFTRATQALHRYMYDELFDVFVENTKSIISVGTAEEARSATETLYTALERGLRLLSPFMPFLTEELWHRLPRRPGEQAISITIADYPMPDAAFSDARSEEVYELILQCSSGIRSLIAECSVRDPAVIYIAPANQSLYETVAAQIGAIKSLCGKVPVETNVLKLDSVKPSLCAAFSVFAELNVYLDLENHAYDAAKEMKKLQARIEEAKKAEAEFQAAKEDLDKVQGQDVEEALQATEARRRDNRAKLRVWRETVEMLERLH